MSIFDRFKNRDNAPLTVEVPFPIENPEITFVVERFSMAEMNEAQIDTEGLLVRRGVKKADEDYSTHYWQAFCYELAKYVKRHVKDWRHTPTDGSEPIPFSKGKLEQLFSGFGIVELTEIGILYRRAEIEALTPKKKETAES